VESQTFGKLKPEEEGFDKSFEEGLVVDKQKEKREEEQRH
jgi:hypothetical protein